jgi:hypothetical protein
MNPTRSFRTTAWTKLAISVHPFHVPDSTGPSPIQGVEVKGQWRSAWFTIPKSSSQEVIPESLDARKSRAEASPVDPLVNSYLLNDLDLVLLPSLGTTWTGSGSDQ